VDTATVNRGEFAGKAIALELERDRDCHACKVNKSGGKQLSQVGQLFNWVPALGTQSIPPCAGFFMFYTYILYSEGFDRYYVGHCEDMSARLLRHNLKKVPSTKAYAPWKVVYTDTYPTRSEPSARERATKKKKSRTYIESLTGGGTGGHIPI